MGQRTMKRVPLDFDWPRNEVWEGYLLPDALRLPTCPTCGGDGQSPEARAVERTFYPHQIGGPYADALAWHDKLGQAEVDHLAAEGRLRFDFGDNPTAARVNAAQRMRGGGFMHDAINRMYLVRFRCERLGIVVECATCRGAGNVGTVEQRAAYEAWEPTEPPTGDGWQLWETTTEGSPVSPVFASAEELAAWCADNATAFGDARMSYGEWLSAIRADEVDIASTIAFAVPH